MNLFITDDILNEVRHHTNSERSSRIKKTVERRALCFLGFACCFWRSVDKKGTSSKAVDNKHCLC